MITTKKELNALVYDHVAAATHHATGDKLMFASSDPEARFDVMSAAVDAMRLLHRQDEMIPAGGTLFFRDRTLESSTQRIVCVGSDIQTLVLEAEEHDLIIVHGRRKGADFGRLVELRSRGVRVVEHLPDVQESETLTTEQWDALIDPQD